ncbi:MAG: hypothetical protein IPF60_16990 [Betaproteobacteria bacterium]|nr:hypothetical protein [Betaproteobacteria bacterium]
MMKNPPINDPLRTDQSMPSHLLNPMPGGSIQANDGPSTAVMPFDRCRNPTRCKSSLLARGHNASPVAVPQPVDDGNPVVASGGDAHSARELIARWKSG